MNDGIGNLHSWFDWQQEKEYKEALEAFNEKNREKAQLVTTLMEVHVKSKFSYRKAKILTWYSSYLPSIQSLNFLFFSSYTDSQYTFSSTVFSVILPAAEWERKTEDEEAGGP